MDSTTNPPDPFDTAVRGGHPPRPATFSEGGQPYTPAAGTNRSSNRAVIWTVGGLLVFSLLFFTFAAGMVFQRFVVTSDAQAAQGDAPERFGRAWDLVHSRYVDPSVIDDEAMLEGAIDGMLESLKDEGHTRYLTAEENQAESESLSGAYVGVGIQVETRDDRIVVVAPIDQSPAMEAGVRSGDILIAIDGRDVTGKSVDEVIGDIRGEEGSTVTLRFERSGEAQPLDFSLTRRKIAVSSVSWTMLGDDIAMIRLSQFSSGAGNDLATALDEAKAAGATGVVLDLRNNPGGYISEAIQVGSMFVPEGSPIFISQVRDGTQTPHLAEPQASHIGDLPLVVLINQGSASSSEIVSGAVKSHNPNATVIGETTFGTGTVLSSFDLGDGASLLLGTELWLTPEGKLIKNRGVRPDVLVGLPEGQFPFVPVDNAEADESEIEDRQLEWALDVVRTGQAGSDTPSMGNPSDRAR